MHYLGSLIRPLLHRPANVLLRPIVVRPASLRLARSSRLSGLGGDRLPEQSIPPAGLFAASPLGLVQLTEAPSPNGRILAAFLDGACFPCGVLFDNGYSACGGISFLSRGP